jgi:hypothetical protein
MRLVFGGRDVDPVGELGKGCVEGTGGFCDFPEREGGFAFAVFVGVEGDDCEGAGEGVGCGEDVKVGYVSAEIEGVSVYEET